MTPAPSLCGTTRGNGIVDPSQPRRFLVSPGFTPETRILTRTSPGPGSGGDSSPTCSTARASPCSSYQAARNAPPRTRSLPATMAARSLAVTLIRTDRPKRGPAPGFPHARPVVLEQTTCPEGGPSASMFPTYATLRRREGLRRCRGRFDEPRLQSQGRGAIVGGGRKPEDPWRSHGTVPLPGRLHQRLLGHPGSRARQRARTDPALDRRLQGQRLRLLLRVR